MLQRSNIEMRLGRHTPSEEDYTMSTQSKSKAAPKAAVASAEAVLALAVADPALEASPTEDVLAWVLDRSREDR